MQCIQCDGSASISELSNQESLIKRQQRVVENSEAIHTTVEAASSLFIAFTVVIFVWICDWIFSYNDDNGDAAVHFSGATKL